MAADTPKSLTATIRCCNMRYKGPKPLDHELQLRIDRIKNPVLGNPFIMSNQFDPDARLRCIEQYSEMVVGDIKASGPIYNELQRLATIMENGTSIALLCWCAPRPCHGDVIISCVKSILQSRGYEIK